MSGLLRMPERAAKLKPSGDIGSMSIDQRDCPDWPSLRDRLNLMQPSFSKTVATWQNTIAAPKSCDAHILFSTNLATWVSAAPDAEKASRAIAADKIRYAARAQVATLNLDNLRLTSLPDCLYGLRPLKVLQLRANALTSLPMLPPALIALKAGSNQLTSLPDLPDSLQELSVYRNALVTLPSLPASLLRLHVYENALQELPQLPPTLERLLAADNALIRCPTVHRALIVVNLAGNSLKNLPTVLTTQVCGLSNSVELLRQYQGRS